MRPGPKETILNHNYKTNLMELANPWTEILSLRNLEAHTGRSIAALIINRIAPPIDLDVVNLQRKKDDDAGNGNSARPSGRGDKVVLLPPPLAPHSAMAENWKNIPWTRSRGTSSSATTMKRQPREPRATCIPSYREPTRAHHPS